MYLRLSCRRFLFYMKERSGLRDWMKNKKIRYERREDIQAKKKTYLPPKLIYRTYLYSTTPNSITSSCNSIGARGVTGTSRFKATVSCAWNNCFIRLKHLRCRILQRKSPVNKRRVFSENAMYRRIRFLDHQASSHKLTLKQGRKAADLGPRNITPASPSFVQIASF